ncbi:MAG: valine--tRNA ligase, partial [Malacoplasma sp.]|nr:valine--tRNA ligase [Malacoplasma sp.]
HAWDGALQDAVIRYKKLSGFNAVWLPGTDHAGISAQTKFDKILKAEGKHIADKKEYLKELGKWVISQKEFIHNQWARMGFALSYNNECYTLDDNANKLVKEVFIKLYKQGLIYQDYKLTNWDCKLQSAISDIEVIHEENKGKLYYFRYYIDGSKDYLVVATTRPETMFGDTNLFVHSKDKRFKKYVGKYAINPVNNEKLLIMTDDYIDIEFGTGVMKCTPAHDFNDYALAKKHKITDYHSIMNMDGTLTKDCVIEKTSYAGIDRLVARDKIVKQLEKLDLVEKIEDYTNQIGTSERTKEIVEPLLSKQWFVKMKPIVADLKKALKKEGAFSIIPSRFMKTLNHWFDNIEDWCISRQLLWGHSIPVYYGPKGEVCASLTQPKGYKQEEGVLDTWYSSGLWPLTTTIYNANNDCSCFYPVSLLVTAYDILFFWVARMLFQCHNLSNTIPLQKVLIHGLIRDEQNRKMSKSLGNGIDPNDVVDQYGADALRIFLTASSTLGEDLRFSNEKIVYMTNFLNKLWNAHNYLNNYAEYKEVKEFKHPLNNWMINEFNSFIKKTNKLFDEYNFSVLTNGIIDFIWNKYCNLYLELIHPLLNDNEYKNETICLMHKLFNNLIIVLHPFCPFITENLYQCFKHEHKSIMEESWPSEFKFKVDHVSIKSISLLIPVIGKIRELRIKNNIKNAHVININLITKDLNKELANSFLKMFNIHLNQISNKPVNKDYDVLTTDSLSIEYQNDFTDSKDLVATLTKQKEMLQAEIKRSEGILNNKGFMAKAPQAKIDAEKAKYEKYKENLKVVEAQLSSLKK